jgi:hypothetical protein
MTTRESLHHLIDELPECALGEAERSLSPLRTLEDDPVLRALLEAPEDDEPLTPEEEAAIEVAREDVRAGRTVSHEEARRILLGEE